MSSKKKKSGEAYIMITVSLPASLLEDIDAAAAADNRNRSNWLMTLAMRELKRLSGNGNGSDLKIG